ncbi:xanthine dehydrogenase/oxidase-like [Schistocerca cancellata]|uniref:xanthine dehydrogenase/oxidase-like n=1 Tax=Schistocerca cancellata TaxID=274614 RepID=UPI0021186774|nr:xanthine dehydrogenase/oxidase-like [Schistocerca cancellata]
MVTRWGAININGGYSGKKVELAEAASKMGLDVLAVSDIQVRGEKEEVGENKVYLSGVKAGIAHWGVGLYINKEMEPSVVAIRFQKVVVFYINGRRYEVDNTVPVDTSLNAYIRNYVNLKGTKSMCHEGGCGSCIVMMTRTHPVSQKVESFAVNSCLMPVFSCHNCKITTIEGIGNRRIGYNAVQKTLAAFNGTQCGYCSPGMVMNMYSLLQRRKNITMEDVENSFGGNICRCTGYRPILDAFKSLSSDAPPDLKCKFPDIEV